MAEIQFFNVFDLDGELERIGEVGNGVVDGGLPAFGGGRRGYGIGAGWRHVQGCGCVMAGWRRSGILVLNIWNFWYMFSENPGGETQNWHFR